METFLEYFEANRSLNQRKKQRRKLLRKDDPWKTKREPREKFQTGAMLPIQLRQAQVASSGHTANVGGGTYVPKG